MCVSSSLIFVVKKKVKNYTSHSKTMVGVLWEVKHTDILVDDICHICNGLFSQRLVQLLT